MAARTPSIHVFLGRPLFLLSPGIHSIINFGSLSRPSSGQYFRVEGTIRAHCTVWDVHTVYRVCVKKIIIIIFNITFIITRTVHRSITSSNNQQGVPTQTAPRAVSTSVCKPEAASTV